MNRHVANGIEAFGKGENSFAEAAEEFLAAHEQDGLSWAEIDRQIGRGHDYARRFVENWRRGTATPFAEPGRERKQQTPVKQADKVKMAEKLLEDPKVVKAVLKKSSIASRGVTNAVIEKESASKRKVAEQAREAAERRKESLPGVSGRASVIVTKLDEWAIELDRIRQDLHELRGRPAELVDMSHANLIRAAEENRVAIGKPAMLRVIEGSASRSA